MKKTSTQDSQKNNNFMLSLLIIPHEFLFFNTTQMNSARVRGVGIKKKNAKGRDDSFLMKQIFWLLATFNQKQSFISQNELKLFVFNQS